MQCPSCGVPVETGITVCECGHAMKAVRQAKPTTGDLKKKKSVYRVKFHGKGMDLLGMHIVNMLLTMVTFGIYYFWGKAKVRRYTYSQTEFMKDRFTYHGNGKELLMGWLRGAAIFFLPMVVGLVLLMSKDPILGALAYVVIYGTSLAIAPLAIVGAQKYKLSRTSLHGIRFSFRGNVKDFSKMFIPGAFLTIFTLGIYGPILQAKVVNYLMNHTYYGNRHFSCNADGKPLIKDYLIALLLHIPTLGMVWFWNMAKVHRHFAEQISFDKAKFRSNFTGPGLFSLNFGNMLLIMFTAGLAFPWVIIRNIDYTAQNLELVGGIDLATIKQEAQQSGSTGEELSDIMDIDIGIGV